MGVGGLKVTACAHSEDIGRYDLVMYHQNNMNQAHIEVSPPDLSSVQRLLKVIMHKS